MPILICQQCGRMFEVTPSREHSARYCSKECQIAATQKKEAKCECCGKEFNPLNRKNPHLCQCSAKRLEPGSVSRKKKRSQGRPPQGKASVRGSCRKELRAVDHRLQMPSMLGKVA